MYKNLVLCAKKLYKILLLIFCLTSCWARSVHYLSVVFFHSFPSHSFTHVISIATPWCCKTLTSILITQMLKNWSIIEFDVAQLLKEKNFSINLFYVFVICEVQLECFQNRIRSTHTLEFNVIQKYFPHPKRGITRPSSLWKIPLHH